MLSVNLPRSGPTGPITWMMLSVRLPSYFAVPRFVDDSVPPIAPGTFVACDHVNP